MMSEANAGVTHGSNVGRNAPCPCGSGKRYKQCHGAADVPGPGVLEVPRSADELARSGVEAHQRNDLDVAERHYREALRFSPEHPAALHYLGVVLYQRQRLAQALPLLARAAILRPDEPEFHNNHGLALADAGRLPEAIAAYRRALDLQPAHPTAWNNLGLAWQLAGEPSAAVDAYRRALALLPDFAQAHWNLALALLLLGRYADGWPEYEWRLRAAELAPHLRDYPGPRWTGNDPRGCTLLLTAEQGLGDTLQNLRLARDVQQRGARVIVAVQRPLVRLAATVPGVAAACAIDEALPAFDAQVSLMSLPGLFGITPENIPAAVPYLRVDTSLRAKAREMVAAHPGGPRNIGLAWSGAAGNRYNARRTCSLSCLAPLLEVEGIRWFSLQKDDEPVDTDDAAHALRLITLEMRNDFDGTAALVDALDLVISVDTSLAHLAGALGKPVWILLPFAPDWRWMQHRVDSPWYPTARLYRQRSMGEWTVPVAAMLRDLRNGDR